MIRTKPEQDNDVARPRTSRIAGRGERIALRSGLEPIAVDRAHHTVRARDSLRRRMLVASDVLAALLVCAVVHQLSGDRTATLTAFAGAPVWVLLAKLQGLYDRDHRTLRHLTVDEVPQLLTWALTGTLALGLLMVVTSPDAFGHVFVGVFAVALISSLLLRASGRSIWRRLTPPEQALIIGDGSLSRAVGRKLELFPDAHVHIVGTVPTEVARHDGTLSSAGRAGIERIILASQTLDEHVLAKCVRDCRRLEMKLSVVPPVRGMFGTAVELRHIADLPVVEYNTGTAPRSTLLLKRALDIAVALPACILVMPFAAVIAAAIRIGSPGPVIFSQVRVGQHGRLFRIYKFRTMVSDAEERLSDIVCLDSLPEPVFKLQSDPRVTWVGRFLRRSSIDELPQLLNVLKGEMSLVGPRPEQVELVARYAPDQRFRLLVKPGITGPMQVFGRGLLTLEERLAVEREYIENHSIARDVLLLALTVSVVAGRRGAY